MQQITVSYNWKHRKKKADKSQASSIKLNNEHAKQFETLYLANPSVHTAYV